MSNPADLDAFLAAPPKQVREKRVYRVCDALGHGPINGKVSAQAAIEVLVTRIRREGDVAVAELIARRLAEACERVPEAMAASMTTIEGILTDTSEPWVAQRLVDILIRLVLVGPHGVKRMVVETLAVVFAEVHGPYGTMVMDRIADAFVDMAASDVSCLRRIPLWVLACGEHAPRETLVIAMILSMSRSGQRPASATESANIYEYAWYHFYVRFSESQRTTVRNRLMEVTHAS